MSAVMYLLAQNLARDDHEFLGVVGGFGAELLLEEFANLSTHQMHRGEDEMVGCLLTQLHDVFPEIAFYNREARFFQRFIEMDLLARHYLRLDDRARLLLANDT